MSRFNVDKKELKKSEDTDIVQKEITKPNTLDSFSTEVSFSSAMHPELMKVQEEFYQNMNKDSNFNIPPESRIMTKQEANENLSKLVAEVYKKLGEAQTFADKHNLSFSLDVEYGMGGSYEEGEWHPSSQSC